MAQSKKLLETLEQRQKELASKIKDAKKVEAKRQAETHKRRCEIIGAAIVARMDKDPNFTAQMQPVIDTFTSKASERKFIGLEPKKSEAPERP